MPMSSSLRLTSPVNLFGRPLFPVLGPVHKYLSLTSSQKRLMKLNPRMPSPVTKLSVEKKASATMHLDIETSYKTITAITFQNCNVFY